MAATGANDALDLQDDGEGRLGRPHGEMVEILLDYRQNARAQ